MTREEQYKIIYPLLLKMIPAYIKGKKLVNCKSNIRAYLKDRLNIKQKGRFNPVVALPIRSAIEDLLNSMIV